MKTGAHPRPLLDVAVKRPPRSRFNLSHSRLMTLDYGKLVPCLCEEAIPGDHWSIKNEIVIRNLPLVAPILHTIKVYVHYFFVPYRILWPDWEAFITGGPTGQDSHVLPRDDDDTANSHAVGTLWDYHGYPVDVYPNTSSDCPIDFPRRAYFKIWNEFYRDQTMQTEVDITAVGQTLKRRAYAKDYFTGALKTQQRGVAPGIPLAGQVPVVFDDGSAQGNLIAYSATPPAPTVIAGIDTAVASPTQAYVDLGGGTAVDVADLRYMFQLQRYYEVNNRCGVRYTEWLHAIFSTSPRDDRLQRPEMIGATSGYLNFSEVLQTSQTDNTPQGTLAGHGIHVSHGFAAKYFVQEYGLIYGILSVMPEAMYQNGIDRQWLRRTRYDFPNPYFAHMSEQAIEQEEIFLSDTHNQNSVLFGYQPMYEECRHKRNTVHGKMRVLAAPQTDLSFWNLARSFASAPALNEAFILCDPDTRTQAVEDEPAMVAHIGHNILCARPLPISGDPGYLDH